MTFPIRGTGRLSTSCIDGLSRMVVDVDKDIVELARALVPPSVRLQRSRYAPHLSVVRETRRFGCWGKIDGLLIDYRYSPEAVPGEVYWWLRVECPELARIRRDLGLPEMCEYTRPPDGEDVFHITIGRL
jgi:hypothetical protein